MNKTWMRLGVAAYWLTWPGTWLTLRFSRRTRLLLRVGDEILVTRTWLSDGRCGLPGGGLHRGEDPLIGVLREVREETGLELQPDQIRPLKTARYRGNGQSFLCHYFIARLDVKPALTLQRFEITASQWASPKRVSAQQYGPDVLAALDSYRPV